MNTQQFSENNISNTSMEEINELMKQDPKAPKKIMIKGKYTKSFRKWNEKAIRDGKTNLYLPKDKLLKYYKNGDSRFINIKFDKRYKNKKVVSKLFKRKNPTYNEESSVLPVAKADYEKVFVPDKIYGDNYNKPSYWYNLLKPFDGNNIRVVIKVFDENPEEEITSELVNYDEEYTLPRQEFINGLVDEFDGFNNIVFNRELSLPIGLTLKKYNTGNFYNTFIVSSRWLNILSYLTQSLKVKCKVFITKLVNLSPIELFQSFNDGGGCLLNPILEFFKDQYATVESKTSKKKYLSAINLIQGKQLKSGFKKGLLQLYNKGVPQDKIQEVCDELQVGIDIYLPFDRHNYISCRSHKKPRKMFKFVNRTINHVEISHIKHIDKDTIFLERDEIERKLEEIERGGQTPYYSRDAYGVSAIYDISKLYKLVNPYRDCVNEWSKENAINSYYIDALKYPDLIKFVGMACKWNGCIDFKNLNNINIDDCHHIDIKKAYTQFKQSQYYDGFVGKITDFRIVDNYNEKGCYLIKDLDLSNADPKFITINNKLKWFQNKNVYWDTELEALECYGGKFKVVCGAFGVKTDFDFNEELIKGKIKCFAVNGKEVKISYYAKMVGEWGSINYENNFNMKGDRRFFENMVNEGFRVLFNDYNNEATIKFTKPNVKSLKHLAGQVTAYQRLLVLDKLMDMDIDKLARVCVDGIYYLPHHFKGVEKINSGNCNLWSCKNDEKTFKNGACASYVSGLMNNELYDLEIRNEDEDEDPYKKLVKKVLEPKINMRKVLDQLTGYIRPNRPYKIIMGMKIGDKKDFYKTQYIGGQGGTGKSYNMLHDWGVIGGLYVSPSWKLATHQAKEIGTGDYNHNFDTNVFHRLVNMDYEYKLTQKNNWLFIDECSMITEDDKEKLIKMFGGKITFMGDLGYQLEPVLNEADKKKFEKSGETDLYKWIRDNKKYEMTLKGIENKIYFNIDRRAKDCEELQKLKLKLREYIKKGKKAKGKDKIAVRQEAIELVKKTCKKGSIDEYNKKDLILASKHEFNKEYDEKFKEIEKYKIENNTRHFKNGEIVFNKPEGVKCRLAHGYTIHEIQGETANNKLYIDLRKMFSDRMIYTAISRARKLSQIRLIY